MAPVLESPLSESDVWISVGALVVLVVVLLWSYRALGRDDPAHGPGEDESPPDTDLHRRP